MLLRSMKRYPKDSTLTMEPQSRGNFGTELSRVGNLVIFKIYLFCYLIINYLLHHLKILASKTMQMKLSTGLLLFMHLIALTKSHQIDFTIESKSMITINYELLYKQ